MHEYTDRTGRAISRAKWLRLRQDVGYGRVAETTTQSGHWVSTIWLGLDRQATFEILVQPQRGSWVECVRVATEEEARAAHQRMVEKWSSRAREV